MAIDTQTIIKLRQMTGAGMVDCKKALVAAEGDLDKAIEILRKNGEAKAAKKAERETNEGIITLAESDGKVAYVALKSETDFVARNEDFIAAGKELAEKLLTVSEEEFKTLAETKIKNELVVKIGENIQLGDYGVVSDKVVGAYLHSNKKVAAIVTLSAGTKDVAVDVGMQIVAMSPEYLKPENVPAEVVDKEKEIATEQLKKEGKPAEIIEKIIGGKITKYYQEACLTKQMFIKDDKVSVEDYVKSAADGAEITSFIKIEL
ncbi:elongation factor Ts [Candidatus Falkowbacteria bacterium CG10_big_fil_rev_8_21_14_0_10_39_11]|uniref:Elongation factor Ts n=1 Tax=Candidatus Falkowbacteria bacterium CG10_big_fil_rev_8_21_14_0_10_39_11 TaxID=1974565 RepID=A0A2H0V6B9_9BACT|nr:MAG: elongation factor Ts [Candidatus Falkowbacteria bacterium CG10_big_fil_rev_8_21_14_0_10_39_11]